MENNLVNTLLEKLNEFIKKYYLNQLIKGSIYMLSILLIFFLLFSIIEYFSSFGVLGRTFLFWSYIIINIIVFVKLLFLPMLHLFKIGKSIKHKDAAKIIGKHFPEIDDKLLNVLELYEITDQENKLITASINQKIISLSPIPFKNAINFSINKKHLKWALIPTIIVLGFIISGKHYVLSESSKRILLHNTFFEPKAPFNYVFLNNELKCKQFDDFLLQIKVEGREIPAEVFIKSEENYFKMVSLGNNIFEYSFVRVHSDLSFKFSAGGYSSQTYTIKSLLHPKVLNMKIHVYPPKYTKKNKDLVENTGDITVNEGSLVMWEVLLKNSDKSSFVLNDSVLKASNNNKLEIKTSVLKNTKYSIVTYNENNFSDTLDYFIKIIPDEFPKISLTQSYDSTNHVFLFDGIVEDDYMLEKLEFVCSHSNNDSSIFFIKKIPIKKSNLDQFFFPINFDTLNLEPEKEVIYYLRVWDNDEINGSKFTKSNSFSYKEPSKDMLIKNKDLLSQKTKDGLNKSIMLAQEIQDEINSLNKTILEKKNIGWKEKEALKNILEKQKKLEKQIKDNQKNNSKNLKTQEKINSSLLEKQRKLEELMNNILSDETKDLLKELKEIMDDSNKEKLKNLLEKLENENIDLEKELDRELELFKQLELEQKIEEVLDKIHALKEKQKELKKETENGEKNNLLKKQKEIKSLMEDIQKSLNDVREKNMVLEEKIELPKTKSLEEKIKENIQKSILKLEKGQKNKSKKSQQNVIEKIEELDQMLKESMQASGDSKPVEDMETLRKILENLIQLSFDQEELLNKTYNTPKNSSEFITLVQNQKELSDNSKIIEDSLFALSKRVVQIQATINQEISSIKSNMQKATNELEVRGVKKALERQQFVMTSCNNLALLLSEILEQMQKQLDMPTSQCNKPKNCNKPNPNCNKPSLSEIEKAQKKLNQKIKNKINGKDGKGKNKGEKESKELMMLSNKQEQIREQLMRLRDEIGVNGKRGEIDKLIKEMEETERDIINNQITKETINRQQNILTRLLEVENSEKEDGQENKREAVEWKFKTNNSTHEFLKYQKKKTTQEELLKTTPIQLNPFYKEKVKKYFKKIIND